MYRGSQELQITRGRDTDVTPSADERPLDIPLVKSMASASNGKIPSIQPGSPLSTTSSEKVVLGQLAEVLRPKEEVAYTCPPEINKDIAWTSSVEATADVDNSKVVETKGDVANCLTEPFKVTA